MPPFPFNWFTSGLQRPVAPPRANPLEQSPGYQAEQQGPHGSPTLSQHDQQSFYDARDVNSPAQSCVPPHAGGHHFDGPISMNQGHEQHLQNNFAARMDDHSHFTNVQSPRQSLQQHLQGLSPSQQGLQQQLMSSMSAQQDVQRPFQDRFAFPQGGSQRFVPPAARKQSINHSNYFKQPDFQAHNSPFQARSQPLTSQLSHDNVGQPLPQQNFLSQQTRHQAVTGHAPSATSFNNAANQYSRPSRIRGDDQCGSNGIFQSQNHEISDMIPLGIGLPAEAEGDPEQDDENGDDRMTSASGSSARSEDMDTNTEDNEFDEEISRKSFDKGMGHAGTGQEMTYADEDLEMVNESNEQEIDADAPKAQRNAADSGEEEENEDEDESEDGNDAAPSAATSPHPQISTSQGLTAHSGSQVQYNVTNTCDLVPMIRGPDPLRDLSKLFLGFEKLHCKAFSFKPNLPLAPHRYWIAVLHLNKQPKSVATDKHFLWMKGNRLTTVETVWRAYQMSSMAEDFVLMLGHETMDFKNTMQELDLFGDKFVCLRAVSKDHTESVPSGYFGEVVPKNFTAEVVEID